MANDLVTSLKNALIDLLSPLVEAAADSRALEEWLSTLGQTPAISGDPALLQIAENAASIVADFSSFDASKAESFAGIAAILADGRKISVLESQIRQFANDPKRSQAAEGLAEEIVALLLASYLRRNFPIAFRVASVLALVNTRDTNQIEPAIVKDGVTLRYPRTLDTFNFNAVSGLFSDPRKVLQDAYFPNKLAAGAYAWTAATRVFPNLSFLADELGIEWKIDYQSSVLLPPPPDPGEYGEVDQDDSDQDYGFAVSDTDTASETLYVPTPIPESYYASYFPGFSVTLLRSTSEPGSEIALEVQCSSSSHPGATPGYIVSVVGSLDATTTFDSWKLTLTSKGQVPAFVLKPSGFGLVPTAVPLAGGAAQVLLERLPAPGATGPVFLVGSSTGTRLEIGNASVQADFSYDPAHIAAAISAKVSKCSFVINPGDGDGFLSSVLPSGGFHVDFDLGLTFSSDNGLSIQGGAGLDVTLPIGLSLGGVLTVPSLYLGLDVNGTGLQMEVSATAGLMIGPVAASVVRLGMLGIVTFPPDGGNFGPIEFDLDFKPPSGVGLSVDASGVSGGGVLISDSANHEYSGMLQLQFDDIALQAFGLITTGVAGGSGYSLLAMIDADFPPIQLGWGFTLNGAGGLLAVHRTANTDKLRAALKADKLSTILFPKSAISNAPLVLAQLDALFPTAQGRFLFGPMALIGWGTPTLLTVALAVILELPEPVRILLLARLALRLPAATAPLVKINMDALGVLDLSQGQFSLDATLYDSKITGFTLSGDMALRANWGTQREFLLAIGGFHPQFTPPAGFPSLQRVTVDMPSASISKMRLAAYLAITSNTLQFGADLDVYIGVPGFGLAGHLAFDAMLQYVPLHFDTDISASIGLMAGSDTLMSVGLDATLSGPGPWHIAGKFKIHFFFFDIHISFSATWGSDGSSVPIQSVDVMALLTAAFADSRNWGTLLPDKVPALVSLRSQDGTTVIANPMALLEVHERVVPLDLQITRFGAAPITTGPATYSITSFAVGTWSGKGTTVMDDFAPAQFFDLTDEEKLQGPSFEQHNAGRIMDSLPVKIALQPLVKTITYETWYVDKAGDLREDSGQKQKVPLPDNLRGVLTFGASGRAAIWSAGNRRFKNNGNGKRATVKPLSFTVASKSTLASAGALPVAGVTYSAARAIRAEAAAKQPQNEELQIVGLHEMAVS